MKRTGDNITIVCHV